MQSLCWLHAAQGLTVQAIDQLVVELPARRLRSPTHTNLVRFLRRGAASFTNSMHARGHRTGMPGTHELRADAQQAGLGTHRVLTSWQTRGRPAQLDVSTFTDSVICGTQVYTNTNGHTAAVRKSMAASGE